MLNSKIVITFMLAFCILMTGGMFQKVHAERVTMVPRMELDYQQDSNFFKTEKDEKSVDAFIVSPGFNLGFVTGKSAVSLDYSLEVYRYSGESDIDDYDYTGHLLNFHAKTQPTSRLFMGIDNYYTKTRDQASSDEYANSVSRAKYSLNRFSPNVLYKFGEKFEVGAKYTNLITDYSEGNSEDSDENRGTFDLNYNFNRSTQLQLDYQVWTRDYDDLTSDYTSNQMMLNLKKSYKNFAITAGAGYHDRDFDRASLDDFGSTTWKLLVEGKTGSSDESSPKSWFNAALSQNYNDAGSGQQYYKATKLELNAGHIFMKSIGLTLKAAFQNSDYEGSDLDEDSWFLACRANYSLNDMVSFALEPGFETRDSNANYRDYDNTYVLFNVKVQYDFAGKM